MNSGDDLLAQAKAGLSLSALMAQLGFGDRAKKSARCPFHNDSSASFSLYVGDDGEERWKCFAGCGQGDAIDFLAKHRGLSNADACREFIRLAGVTPSPSQPSTLKPQPPFDWSASVTALTPDHRRKLADWRGYAPKFVEWLHAQNLIGLFDDERIAFPVHDAQGSVVGCHYRLKEDGSWRYHPTGTRTAPLVIGELATAKTVFVFESQWDLLAVLDCLHHHIQPLADTAAVATRGASNGRLLAGLCAPDAVVLAFGQNDDAGAKWLAAIAANSARKMFQVITPSPHKDPNDWTRAGATANEIRAAIAAAQLVSVSTAPDLHAAPPRNVSMAVTTLPPGDEADEADAPNPFPLSSLPPIAEGIVSEVARVERNPPILPSCAALATLSAATGSGLELVSGPNRTTSGNLYILGTAPSGAGKSRAYDLICKPFLDQQREMMTNWQKDVAPDLKGDHVVLSQRIEQLKAQARKAETDEERVHLRTELKFPLAQLDELAKKLHMPRWSTEDVTIEALADLLEQNHEVIFSMSADGRKVADNLLGRMNPNKRVDDSLYLKGFTRDGCIVDRKDKSPTILNHPCIGIFWLIQPDILDDLVAERSLTLGGFLPRALICHTRTQRQKIGNGVTPISEAVSADWCRLIAELLATYHQPGVHHVIQCSEAALKRLNAHFDQTVDQGVGELADMESFVARWTEQAWHLAVVLHACLWGKEAHNHTLDLVTAEAAIAIADWFASQQKGVLARGRHEARRKKEDRVLDLLDDNWNRLKKDYFTHRDVQRAGITTTADEARALLARMEADGVLVSEELRRPEGGHAERRYRLKIGRNPIPG